MEEYDIDVNDLTGTTSYKVTLVSSTPTDPTEPTNPTEPTKTLTVNGQKVNKGDQVVFEAKLSASQVLSYVEANVKYTSGILEMSKISASVNNGVFTNINTGAKADLRSVDGTAKFTCSNSNGYNFTSEKVFVKLVFNVIADEGAATITTNYTSLKNVSGSAVSAKTNTSSIKVIADGAKDDIFLGDLDGNENISVSDAIALQKAIANVTTLNDAQKNAGNVNFDGSISVSDAILVQKVIAGISSFSYPSRY